ncbi:MAG: hypothetical protein GF350_00235 [Chitinivibrionales bacterium]|nr:hypothetical protein [Chitinivibrionales bacterium]
MAKRKSGLYVIKVISFLAVVFFGSAARQTDSTYRFGIFGRGSYTYEIGDVIKAFFDNLTEPSMYRAGRVSNANTLAQIKESDGWDEYAIYNDIGALTELDKNTYIPDTRAKIEKIHSIGANHCFFIRFGVPWVVDFRDGKDWSHEWYYSYFNIIQDSLGGDIIPSVIGCQRIRDKYGDYGVWRDSLHEEPFCAFAGAAMAYIYLTGKHPGGATTFRPQTTGFSRSIDEVDYDWVCEMAWEEWNLWQQHSQSVFARQFCHKITVGNSSSAQRSPNGYHATTGMFTLDGRHSIYDTGVFPVMIYIDAGRHLKLIPGVK